MSIAALHRVTLAGLVHEKRTLLDELQALGCLHLVPLRPSPREPERTPPEHAVEARKALRYLRDLPEKRRQVHEASDFDLAGTVRAVLDNQQRLRDASDRRDALRARLRELEPWGDFTLPPPEDLAGRKLWFYILPLRQARALDALELPWHIVHRDNRQIWLVVISEDEPPHDLLPVARAHTGALSLAEVARQLEGAELDIEEIQAERHALTRWIYLLASHLAQAEDEASLRHAESQTLEDEALCLVQGWVAERDLEAVRHFAEERRLALLSAPASDDDRPPTLLDNPPALAAGQDLVAFYQVPAYHAWDPSRVLFGSFTLFFAMILSDAGYALVLSGLLAAFWRRLGQGDLGRRLRLLAAALCSASLLWGVLIGSYFGVTPSPDSFAGRLQLFDLNDFNAMMRLSVAIGVLHLVLANLELARAARAPSARLGAIGWSTAMLGGFIAWLGSGSGPDWLSLAGQLLLGGGLATVFLFGSERPVVGLGSLFRRLLDGLAQLARLTQAFGDVLSYLRLFALGLASSSLALTFNDLARGVYQELPGLGLLFAILILLVGHVLNLLLCLMSGVVHGLRLNFIEFYNWGLSGEGYPFRPFKKTEPSS
ncbi:MAG: V-type ATP synthase subunit I [Chromatiaceae bacterium]|nr:V-type ATP synthase subunit I [Chromatiaceae bacterium]